jgi:hypothetical protein
MKYIIINIFLLFRQKKINIKFVIGVKLNFILSQEFSSQIGIVYFLKKVRGTSMIKKNTFQKLLILSQELFIFN